MPGAEQRREGDVEVVDLLSVILISRDAELRERVEAALGQIDLGPSATIDSAATVVDREIDDLAILLLACDINVPREITSLRRLRRAVHEAAIVVISQIAGGAAVRRALDAGADALVFAADLELTLATTIRAVASGQSVVPRKLRASVQRPTLSHREHQVLTLVDEGLTNAEIAERLYLAESTIKSHLASIFTKFGVHSRKEATAVFADLAMPPATTPAAPPETRAEQKTA